MVRVAVLDKDKCKPKECQHECRNFCPEVRTRIEVVVFAQGEDKPPTIVENLCTGCGICVKKCPFGVIFIVNLPEELEEECSHRYGPNLFKLYRLPIPAGGTVTGLVGRNGTGKSTVLRLLAGEMTPNLGNCDNPPSWKEVIKHYRGSTLQEYFGKLSRKELKIVHKPQYIDRIPQLVKGKVSQALTKVDERNRLQKLIDELDLRNLLDRELAVLSGGELQRVAIAAAASRDADVYIFDEPSSHLDVSQRIKVARTIRELAESGKSVLLAEHDLAMLDYLSDQISVFYGEPSVYGIVSHTHGVRVGINIFLDGFIPDENMRFRDDPIRFHVKPPREAGTATPWELKWQRMRKKYKGFELDVETGEIKQGEIIGVLGPNGIGKTTFIKLLAGADEPDEGERPSWGGLTVSYKPQYISANYQGSVRSLLSAIVGEKYETENFQNSLVKPFSLHKFHDRLVSELSGGELQRVAIAACLAKDAQIYLLDEPSAYLDVEERLIVARVIRRIVEERQAFAFVVEHDLVALDFVADRLMIFNGEPGVKGHGGHPLSLRDGMNLFLEDMEITFRRDPESGRPRVNKLDSKLDRSQKEIGQYYYVEEKV